LYHLPPRSRAVYALFGGTQKKLAWLLRHHPHRRSHKFCNLIGPTQNKEKQEEEAEEEAEEEEEEEIACDLRP
jgi:hypothetical protein